MVVQNEASFNVTERLTDLTVMKEIMTDMEFIIFEDTISGVGASLAVVGIVGNIVNIATFISMGVNDGVSLTFLFLSALDLAYLVIVTAMDVSFIFMSVETLSNYSVWFPVEPYGVYGFLSLSTRYPYEASSLTTICLSVVRCICVAKPIKFRKGITKRAAACIFVSFLLLSITFFTPVLSYMGMADQYIASINATRSSVWISPTREKVMEIIWTATDALIPLSTQVVIVICVLVMSKSLRSIHEFRQKNTSRGWRPFEKTPMKQSHSVAYVTGKSERDRMNESGSLGKKDLQVVQQVVLISTVYIVCNTPIIVINFAGMYNREFALRKTYHNLFLSMLGVKHLFQTINSSFNIFIYFRYSSKYRQTLLKNLSVYF